MLLRTNFEWSRLSRDDKLVSVVIIIIIFMKNFFFVDDFVNLILFISCFYISFYYKSTFFRITILFTSARVN